MNPSFKMIGLTAFFLMGLLTIQIQSSYSAIPQLQDCACGNSACGSDCGVERQRRCGCQRCAGKRANRKCPKCDCEFCTLEVKQVEEEKTCFKTEQKIVCVPTVRMPWQKCCPGTSKTRTVNVLKKEKYKCPACKYTWSVNEPELTFSQTPNEATPPIVEPAQAEQPYQPPVRAYQPAIQTYPASGPAYPAPVLSHPSSFQTNQGLRLFPVNQNSYRNSPYQAPAPSGNGSR